MSWTKRYPTTPNCSSGSTSMTFFLLSAALERGLGASTWFPERRGGVADDSELINVMGVGHEVFESSTR